MTFYKLPRIFTHGLNTSIPSRMATGVTELGGWFYGKPTTFSQFSWELKPAKKDVTYYANGIQIIA